MFEASMSKIGLTVYGGFVIVLCLAAFSLYQYNRQKAKMEQKEEKKPAPSSDKIEWDRMTG